MTATSARSLRLHLSGKLLDLDDDELRRFEGCEPDENVDDAEVDVVLRGRLGVALHEVRFARAAPLKCALADQVLHECADREANLPPERLVVGLEDDPLR